VHNSFFIVYPLNKVVSSTGVTRISPRLPSRNRKEEFYSFAKETFDNIEWVTYDRKTPENFNKGLLQILKTSDQAAHIVIDISAMSKMLIVVLLYGLRKTGLPVSIVYAPAKVYHPLKEKFEEEKTKSKFTESLPYFLTTDVNTVVTTSELSSIAMQGAPIALIAFPNFNHREISALLNETSAQKVFFIEGNRKSDQNGWRLDAIKWINHSFESYTSVDCKEVNAADINGNIKILDGIYQENYLTHKIALSPTGGKLQAVATFCLKVMHPDIHIVYPVVRQFAEDYTEGYFPHIEIPIKNFLSFTKSLDRHRLKALSELEQILKNNG